MIWARPPYHLKESKEFSYYELVPWDRRSRLIANLPLSFRYWKLRYFFVSGDDWETLFDNFWGDVPRLLRQWETFVLGAFALHFSFSFFNYFFFIRLFAWTVHPDLVPFFFLVKDHLELESRFAEHVRAVIEYASTIDDFDDLVDPRTLAHHCLGPKPSHYVLRAIHREEKSKFL